MTISDENPNEAARSAKNTFGEELMRIVPDGASLEIEAFLENEDIGFVHEGQEAIIKVESFPFPRYGTLIGRVTHITRDSIPAPDAQRVEADPTQAAKPPNTFAPPKQTQNLVYATTIAIRADRRVTSEC